MSIYRGRNKNEIYLASLLYDAIEDSDLRSVQLLLSTKGADSNLVLPRKKISPFHLVIGNDSEEFALKVTLLILQHGGNPNVQSDDGLTPVHIAAAWGRYDILKLLLDCGGNPEYRDVNKKTALDYALEEKFHDCWNLLKLYISDKVCRGKEDSTHYTITLDKILVNNGTTVGEYEVVNEYKTNSNSVRHLQKLENLPQSNSKEYVMNWFNNQLQGSNVASKVSTGIGNNTDLDEESVDSLKESDVDRANTKDICFRKVFRKKMKTPKKKKASAPVECDVSYVGQFSKESGISILLESSLGQEGTDKKDVSSDYVTCTTGTSPDLMERNIFELGSFIESNASNKSVNSVNTKSEGISSSDLTFVSVSEVYKYVDQEEGVVLYERRFLKTPLSDCSGSVMSFASNPPLPETVEYEDLDVETIRKELTLLGYAPGPITVSTKRVYLKKLTQLKKLPPSTLLENEIILTKVYSCELEKTLKNPNWTGDLLTYKRLDDAVVQQFTATDAGKKWREGNNKSSFTYLLLDPRKTNNLPTRSETLNRMEIWENFLSAVFYVGKGKRSRPYDHLYEAVNLWNRGTRKSENKKLQRILDIWSSDHGVVCLHVFHNTIPVEAYTREAAIIDALKVDNLCNLKGGNFYGVAATWTPGEKTRLGVYLLHKALMIFLHDGERQLCPSDIN